MLPSDFGLGGGTEGGGRAFGNWQLKYVGLSPLRLSIFEVSSPLEKWKEGVWSHYYAAGTFLSCAAGATLYKGTLPLRLGKKKYLPLLSRA